MKKLPLPKRSSFLGSLKDGFLLILPLWATVAIFLWLWSFVFGFFPDFARFFPLTWRNFPYFDVLLNLAFMAVLAISVLIFGILGPTFLGKFFLELFDRILEASPLIKPIYGTLKKLSSMLFSAPEEDSVESKLTEAVLVPYPTENDWSIAFITNHNACHFFGEEKGEEYITVYMPSSPIVSSGYYLTVKRADVRPCKSDAGQAMGTLLSAGSLQATSVRAPLAPPQKKKSAFLRKHFFNGLLIMMPMLGTASLFIWAFNWILKYVRTMRILIPQNLQGMVPDTYFGLIANSVIILILIMFIYLLGKIGESALGKALKKGFILLANKIPVFNTVYEATSTITEIFTKGAGESEFFSKAALVNFPNKKLLAVCFITHSNSAHLMEGGEDYIPIFLPTSPIPTTGWFMNMRKEDIHILDMPVERAIALVISLGIISADNK